MFLRWTFLDSFWSQPTGMGWDDSEESIPTQSIHTVQTKRHQGYWSFSFTPPFPETSGHFGFPLLRIATSFGVFNCLSLKFSSRSKCSTVSTCLCRDMPTWSNIHNFPKSSVQSESYDVDGRPKPKYRWKELKDVKHQSYMLPIKCYPPLVQYQPIKSR